MVSLYICIAVSCHLVSIIKICRFWCSFILILWMPPWSRFGESLHSSQQHQVLVGCISLWNRGPSYMMLKSLPETLPSASLSSTDHQLFCHYIPKLCFHWMISLLLSTPRFQEKKLIWLICHDFRVLAVEHSRKPGCSIIDLCHFFKRTDVKNVPQL